MSRAQPDWEATRAIVQASIVAASSGTRSMRVEEDGHVVLVHDGRTSRWWVDPERSHDISTSGAAATPPWQVVEQELDDATLLSRASTDHGSAFRGDACIDAALVSYLVDLDLPA